MSNALHDYASLFERYSANNGGTGVILAGEDCLSLANEMRIDADAIDVENAKLRELVVLNWEWAHSCCGNNCKMQTNDCGYQIDRECNYEREIWDRMRELGVEVNDA